jgi:L-iditol 2-dehydrogenase
MPDQLVAFLLGPEEVEVRAAPRPTPGAGEVLLRVEVATTCGTDLKVFLRGGHPRMLRVPCPFGHEAAGVVAAVGAGVKRVREGDRVVAANSAACGACAACRRGRENLCEDMRYLNGAFARYVLVPARFVDRSLHLVPAGLEPRRAALAEPLACVLHGLECCPLDRPQEVVLYGAGPIGLMFAAVLARQGHRVLLADTVAERLEIGRRLGAAETIVVDGSENDPEKILERTRRRTGVDVVLEATGAPLAWRNALATARAGGSVVLFGGCAPGTTVPLDTHRMHYSELTVKGVYHHRPATFAAALELLASGDLEFDLLLTGERPLEEVEDALRAMADRRALKVVIRP